MDEHQTGNGTAIDPVCEMVVDPKTARSAEVGGMTYYFCSEGCRTKFVADPEKYLNRVPFVLPVRRLAATTSHEHPGHDHTAHNHAHFDRGMSPHGNAAPPPAPHHVELQGA